MKIYTRGQFMSLPAGTLYAKGPLIAFEGLTVKGFTIYDRDGRAIDWSCRSLTIIASSDTGDLFDQVSEMVETGVSRPLDDAYFRDGCYDEEEFFLVFERDDLIQLAKVVDEAMQVAAT